MLNYIDSLNLNHNNENRNEIKEKNENNIDYCYLFEGTQNSHFNQSQQNFTTINELNTEENNNFAQSSSLYYSDTPLNILSLQNIHENTNLNQSNNIFPNNWNNPQTSKDINILECIQSQSISTSQLVIFTLFPLLYKKLLKYGFNLNELIQPSHSQENFIFGSKYNTFISNTILHPICIETYSKKKNIIIVHILNPQRYENIEIIINSSSDKFLIDNKKINETQSRGIYMIEFSILRKKKEEKSEVLEKYFKLILNFYSNGILFDDIVSTPINYNNSTNQNNNPSGRILLNHKLKCKSDIYYKFLGIFNSIKKSKTQHLIVLFKNIKSGNVIMVPQKLESVPESERYRFFSNNIINFSENTIKFKVKIPSGIYNISFYYNSKKGINNIETQISNYNIN